MSNLTELTAQIIAARAAKKDMSKDEFLEEMQMVYSFLKGIKEGNVQPITQEPVEEVKPKLLTIKQAFKKDEVICMVCNKGFKTLKRHLLMAHDLKPGEYRKQFGIPSKQSLVAKNYSESRRQMAIDKGLGEGLLKARELKVAKKTVVPAVEAQASVTKVKAGSPVPTVKTKAAGPAVKKKNAVSAKTTK